jgi:hypothetical protein
MRDLDATFFTRPTLPTHRLYEAIRAFFVDKIPVKQIASHFGYAPGTLHVLCSRFRKSALPPFFRVSRPGPQTQPKKNRARDRVFELRKKNYSVYDINRILTQERCPLSVRAIWEILHEAGFARLPRRLDEERPRWPRPEAAAVADRRDFVWSPVRFRTQVGGLYLLLPWITQLNLPDVVRHVGLPGSKMIPALQYLLSLLALKLAGRERLSHVMDLVHDRGAALFAGLNALPKTTSLTTYSYRVKRSQVRRLLEGLVRVLRPQGALPGRSFNLDFHAIAHFGEQSVLERHYVPRRSHAEKSILTFLAQDGDTRVLCYSNARILKRDQAHEVLRFAEFWKDTTGHYPRELVFDSKLTTVANLAKLQALGIRFLTLRARKPAIVRDLMSLPERSWTTCTLDVPHRKFRTPKIIDQRIHLKHYPGEIRQIAAKNLGRDLPTLLLTNNFHEAPGPMLTRYAQRMLVENAIADGVHFFHLDSLCSGVQIEVDFSVAVTIVANAVYRLFARHIKGFERAQAKQLHRRFINTGADIVMDETGVEVILPRRSHNPLLLEAEYGKLVSQIPWWKGRTLRFTFR